PDLAAKLDDHGIGGLEPFSAAAMLDGVDDLCRHAFLQRLRLVRHPFELAVHLARCGQNGDLADARREARLKAQIAVDRVQGLARAGTVKPNASRPLQPGDRRARRAGAVVGALAYLVQILAAGPGPGPARTPVRVRTPRGAP